MTCLQATDTVVLHSNNLNINTEGVAVSDGGGKVVAVTGVAFVPKTELMHVKSAEKFKPGNEYVLTIPFMGNITDDLVGYYRSSYIDKETNQTRFVWRSVTGKRCCFAVRLRVIGNKNIVVVLQVASSDPIRTGGCPKSFPVFRRARAESNFQNKTGS